MHNKERIYAYLAEISFERISDKLSASLNLIYGNVYGTAIIDNGTRGRIILELLPFHVERDN